MPLALPPGSDAHTLLCGRDYNGRTSPYALAVPVIASQWETEKAASSSGMGTSTAPEHGLKSDSESTMIALTEYQ